MSLKDQLDDLNEQHAAGELTDEEYSRERARLLARSRAAQGRADRDADWVQRQTEQWSLLLHLSQLSGWMIPFGGLVVPILIWQLKKEELPDLDEHGKVVANWLISRFLYGLICLLLCLILIGIPLLLILILLGILFPIIGGVKANRGEVWRYPLSITFLK